MPSPVLVACSLIFLLCFSTVLSSVLVSAQPEVKGPYIDEARFILRGDENVALEDVKSGGLDMYFFRIPLESASDAAKDDRISLYPRTAGSIGLLINPAPPLDGSKLNPFASREARYALNFLVNRDLVANEILRGYGSPMGDPFGLYSPEYLNVIDIVESFGFSYNPSLAESMISKAMTDAGAEKTDGKWTYKGSPVTVSILIRQDDAPRKSLGEIVASELEKIGLTVDRNYGDLQKANSVVYGSNPAELQWQIYTEGFAGTSAFVKYNPVVPAQMYGPWYGNLPGGQNPSFWSYQNSTLDEVTQKILFFNFTSEQERNDLVRQAVKMGMQESVRMFVAQKTDPYVASAKVTGLVNDFGAGITSKYALLNAQQTDGKKSLDIGVKQIHQGSWNLIGGLLDTYSRDIYSSVGDTGTFRDPYTGEIIPVRAEWTDVTTAGPLNRLDVPSDAVEWNAKEQKWQNVEGAESKSSVTFKPLYSNWHNGIPMDISDFMYPEYFTYEWGTNTTTSTTEDRTYDPEFSSQAEVSLQYLKGFKFTPDSITNYVDQWHYDKTEIADSGIFWPSEPWELTAAAERLVMDGKLAFSRTQATSSSTNWYDPIVKEHADLVKAELQRMKDEQYVPPSLAGVVSPDQAAKRYDASIKWITDHGHAIISNGAFYLDSYNAAGNTITIKAFRDPTYPFEQGHWRKFQEPLLASVGRVDVPAIATMGQPASVGLDVAVGSQPSNDANVYYFVFGRGGSLVSKGEAKPTDEVGRFQFDLPGNVTKNLSSGPNQLKIFVTGKDAFRLVATTNTLLATSGGSTSQQPGNNTSTPTPTATQQPSGCLIATAAFGSELTPQVQFLRNFREQYILSTASGSAFMQTFNSIYYSFSPQVADYERGQPWLQSAVRTAIYPLFGILMASEQAHFAAGGGEGGAVAAGTVAGLLIGAVYLWPAAVSSRIQSRFAVLWKVLVVILAATLAVTVAGIVANSAAVLSIATSAFIVALVATASVLSGRLARRVGHLISSSRL